MSNLAHRLAALGAAAAIVFTVGSAWAATTSSHYVQDGLVANWDGIDNAVDANGVPYHDPEATVWRDVKGGYEFSLTSVEIGDSYLGFDGTDECVGAMTVEDSAAVFTADSVEKTIEIVIRIETSVNCIPFYGPASSDVSFGPYNNKIILTGNRNTATYPSIPALGTTNSFSTVYKSGPQSLYLNGKSSKKGNNSYWAEPPNHACLNYKNSYGGKFKGKIFAIRVYDHALTSEEVAYNRKIDEIRFYNATDPLGFYVAGEPKDCNTTPATLYYGKTNVVAGTEFSVPAVVPFNNGTYHCLGYKFYRYDGELEDYVELPERGGSGLTFTVDASDVELGGKLVWQWEIQYRRTTADYVQAGLIANWDGIQNATNAAGELCHDFAATTWRDVQGGYEFALSNVIVGIDNLIFNGTDDCVGLMTVEDSAAVFAAANVAKTIEIVIGFNKMKNCIPFYGPASSDVAFGPYKNNSIIISGEAHQAYYPSVPSVGAIDTYSTSYKNGAQFFFKNGENLSKSGDTSWWGEAPDHACLNYKNSSGGEFEGRIYAIRVYDHVLTPEEVAQNALVDGIRFRGAIDPNVGFLVTGSPGEYSDPSHPTAYGLQDVAVGDVLTAFGPALAPAAGIATCTGYELYEDVNGGYVKIDEKSETSYTITEDDVGASRKLVWKWQLEFPYRPSMYAAQEDLVAQWDGYFNATNAAGELYHNPAAKSWRDIVGGLSFSLAGIVAVGDDFMGFNGDQGNYGTIASSAPGFSRAFFSGEKTFEMVVQADVPGNGILFMGPQGSGLMFGPYSTYVVCSANDYGIVFPSKAAMVDGATYSAFYDGNNHPVELSCNGAAVTPPATREAWDCDSADVWLGRRAGGIPCVGHIRAIRIYRRKLNESEIAYNAALDEVRFDGADPATAFDAAGVRPRPDGVLEYRLRFEAGAEGQVKVTANGVTQDAASSVSLWLAKDTPVQVEYVPNEPGEVRFLAGAPDNVDYLTPVKIAFRSTAECRTIEAMPYAYSDANILASDRTVGKIENLYAGRVVYVFTNAAIGKVAVFAKRQMLLDDALIVAGGGGSGNYFSGSRLGGGGGGGGVLNASILRQLDAGEGVAVRVGAGGAGQVDGQILAKNGGDSGLWHGETVLTAIGGGAGGVTGRSGGSGGGGGAGAAGAGTSGQGYAGGKGSGFFTGGGGGAEELGGMAVTKAGSERAGKGGDGRWDMITGEDHCYGSGGGGACEIKMGEGDDPIFAPGGAESGGRGGNDYEETRPEWLRGAPGVNGLGGGGGASGSNLGERGGDGTVILGFTAIDDARVLEVDVIDAYPIIDGEAKPTPAVCCGSKTLTKDEDYEVSYEHNTQNGKAQIVIVGKGDYAGLTRRVPFVASAPRFVKSDGEGDGSDWAHAMNITNAVNGLTNGTYEIWCAAGAYDLSSVPNGLPIRTYTTIRGGFAANDADPTAKAADGAKTVFDGMGVSTYLISTAYSCEARYFATRSIAFEDCTFQRAIQNVLITEGKRLPLSFVRCRFLNNTNSKTWGADALCVYCSDLGGAPVSFTDCEFEGNVSTAGASSPFRPLLWLTGGAITLERCLFVTNGVPCERQTGSFAERGNGGDGIVYCLNCPSVTIRACDFRGNFLWKKYQFMQMVHIEGTSSATIENCRFVGNSLYSAAGTGGMDNGILCLSPAAGSTHTVRNCTFAYNTLDAIREGCAIVRAVTDVDTKKVLVENCVFGENLCTTNNAATRDLSVGAAGTTVRYSLFQDKTRGNFVNIELDDTNLAGVPGFVTKAKVADLLKPGLAEGRLALDPAKIDEILAINVHLKRVSPAVNTGNPKSDWSKEPKPNGKRINMGAYGGTTEATCTPPGTAVRVK